MRILAIILSAMLLAAAPLKFDKTVHDFGEISVKAGPQTCTFTITNTAEEPLNIYAVVSSCGCTNVTWTRDTIEPGKTGKVTATYSNDEGPYTFDKTLSVYTSAQKKPFLLHLKGTVRK